ncbi:MAG: hypothetical protein O3C10_10380, partial [Chloroflexi bacterium]|nr:hypothetical protein [Chloroflexota bacterium]
GMNLLGNISSSGSTGNLPWNVWQGLEELRSNSSGLLHGDIMMFMLVQATDGVHLVTILDSPNEITHLDSFGNPALANHADHSNDIANSVFNAGGGNEGGHARICYAVSNSGVPTNTTWSVKDDSGGGDTHKTPLQTAIAGTAEMNVTWLDCCTDGGALTPTTPFDCHTKICVDIKSTVGVHGSSGDGIGPVCFVTQMEAPATDWTPVKDASGASASDKAKAPKIRVYEVGGDFCLSADWEWPSP